MKIQNSLVLITGASAGIGAATAKAIAKKGGRVLLLARTQSALEGIANAIRADGGAAQVYPVDLADPLAVERTFNKMVTEIGHPDILINNAGAGHWLFTEETTPEEAMQMMAVPYFAAFYITRLCLPEMLKRRSGHIVNINSPVARGGWPGAAGYTAARYALQGFTTALRLDLHGTGVRVTSIVPGKVRSEYFTRNSGVEERIPAIGKIIVPTLSTEQVATITVRAIEQNKREVVFPFMLKVFFFTNHFFPWLVEWLIVSTGWRHERNKQGVEK